jgi:REP element-mobilizing transposase RayT
MLDDYGFEIYEENAFPLAYLLTFRTYGTWLHGDQRGSYTHQNRDHGSKYISPNVPLRQAMEAGIKNKPIILTHRERGLVHEAIMEVSKFREYDLKAINVRSNHTHAVVSKALKPEKIVNDFKAYATRRLRSDAGYPHDVKIWARGASTKYLWKPRHVELAIDYVLYSQGDVDFETVTGLPNDKIG